MRLLPSDGECTARIGLFRAYILADKRQAEAGLTAFIERLPHLAAMYDVTLAPDKRPDGASVTQAANTQVVIQVALEDDELSA
jgi:hypothetical protein